MLAPAGDAELIAGIRPEALIQARGGGFDPVLSLAIEHSEYLGADTVLTGRVAPTTHRLQARLPGRCVAAPARWSGSRSPDAVHLFDAITARGWHTSRR